MLQAAFPFNRLPAEKKEAIIEKLQVRRSLRLLQVNRELRAHVLRHGPLPKVLAQIRVSGKNNVVRDGHLFATQAKIELIDKENDYLLCPDEKSEKMSIEWIMEKENEEDQVQVQDQDQVQDQVQDQDQDQVQVQGQDQVQVQGQDQNQVQDQVQDQEQDQETISTIDLDDPKKERVMPIIRGKNLHLLFKNLRHLRWFQIYFHGRESNVYAELACPDECEITKYFPKPSSKSLKYFFLRSNGIETTKVAIQHCAFAEVRNEFLLDLGKISTRVNPRSLTPQYYFDDEPSIDKQDFIKNLLETRANNCKSIAFWDPIENFVKPLSNLKFEKICHINRSPQHFHAAVQSLIYDGIPTRSENTFYTITLKIQKRWVPEEREFKLLMRFINRERGIQLIRIDTPQKKLVDQLFLAELQRELMMTHYSDFMDSEFVEMEKKVWLKRRVNDQRFDIFLVAFISHKEAPCASLRVCAKSFDV